MARSVGFSASPLLFLALAQLLTSLVLGSRFQFALTSRTEECFYEEVNARASDNKLLFRFGIVEPKAYDFVDVQIKNPSLGTVVGWNSSQNDFVTTSIRETGLYHVCFRRVPGSSSTVDVFYAFDVVSTGSISVVIRPTIAATVSDTDRNRPNYMSGMNLATTNGKASKFGVVEFDVSSVSPSIVRGNTRVQLLLSVENTAQEKIDISVSSLPSQAKYPITWANLAGYAENELFKRHVFDNAEAELGSAIAFDITELFATRVAGDKRNLAFSVHAQSDGEATISGIYGVAPDYFPQIVVEDLGLDLMREVAYFKETVFTLRGDISYILHRERGSRNAAESANSRVKWLSLLTNVVLVGIALVQVLYIRHMLETTY